MGWLQDGQAFQPTTEAFNSRAVIVSRFQNGDADFFFKHNQGKLNRSIILNIRQLRQSGVYLFNQVARPSFPRTTPAYATYIATDFGSTSRYITSPTATGQLIVTHFDSVAQIVSGTFEFTAEKVSGDGPDAVRLTHGRFDLRYPQ